MTIFDVAKPGGQIVDDVSKSQDPARKAALLEDLLVKFPQSEYVPWALEQLVDLYKGSQPDKVLAAAEKLLAIDPDETEAALQALKASEVKKDLEGVKKYSELSSKLGRKEAALPQPKEADEIERWKEEVSYAKQVDIYSEYALYRVFLEHNDNKLRAEFRDIMLQRYPHGEYGDKLTDILFLAYTQTQQNDKAMALAENTLATTQTNEEMLLWVMDEYSKTKREPEKIHQYSEKLVQLMGGKPKPDAIDEATWNGRKVQLIGLAHYMNGKQYFNEQNYAQVDTELRGAVPAVESNPAAKGEVLYLLGFANYNLKKAQEAANFYRQCAAIQNEYQEQAAKNLAVIKKENPKIK